MQLRHLCRLILIITLLYPQSGRAMEAASCDIVLAMAADSMLQVAQAWYACLPYCCGCWCATALCCAGCLEGVKFYDSAGKEVSDSVTYDTKQPRWCALCTQPDPSDLGFRLACKHSFDMQCWRLIPGKKECPICYNIKQS